MRCIGFIEQWALDHSKVLFTLELESMVLSHKRVDCTLLVTKRRPRERPSTSPILPWKSLVFSQRSWKCLAAERMDGPSSESGFPDKRKKTELIFFNLLLNHWQKWRIHLSVLLWFCFSQKPLAIYKYIYTVYKTNDRWCHSVEELSLIISEFSPKREMMCQK